MQLSAAVRDAMANQIEAVIGAAPTLEIRTGAPPANTAAAATGDVLAPSVRSGPVASSARGGTLTASSRSGTLTRG
jgi:hypothetical protein